MAVLFSATRQKALLPRLEVARRFWDRGRGLLGRAGLAEDQGLMIDPCNSIHTFFMAFPIDCVFVDGGGRVVKIHRDIPPWRLVAPVWRARAVIELSAGSAARLELTEGEELHVGA